MKDCSLNIAHSFVEKKMARGKQAKGVYITISEYNCIKKYSSLFARSALTKCILISLASSLAAIIFAQSLFFNLILRGRNHAENIAKVKSIHIYIYISDIYN